MRPDVPWPPQRGVVGHPGASGGPDARPKLYQNLRSTRQTELSDRFPVHVVCAWLGDSQPGAMKHYL